MYTLAIESSCDETSLALLYYPEKESKEKSFYNKINSITVLSSVISSQIKIHEKFGGVVPEIGARQHADQIHYLLVKILNEAYEKEMDSRWKDLGIKEPLELLGQLQYIFVTAEPGLMSALRVGIEFANSLKFFIKEKFSNEVEVKKVNHLRGHVASSFFVV